MIEMGNILNSDSTCYWRDSKRRTEKGMIEMVNILSDSSDNLIHYLIRASTRIQIYNLMIVQVKATMYILTLVL